MTAPKLPGIYKITGPNGKVYIGSAKNIKVRWSRHRTDLRRGVSKQPKLLAAWKKYGESAFTFDVIEFVNNTEDLLIREQHWIDWAFTTLGDTNVYNTVKEAGHTVGYKHTEEDKKRMSAIRKNNPNLKEYISIATSASMQIRQTEEYGNAVALALSGGKIYTFISPDGVVYENVYSLMRFAKKHNLCDMGLRRIANGKTKQYKGWKGYISNKIEN